MLTFLLVVEILILVLVKKLFDKRTAAAAKGKRDAASSAAQGCDSSSSSSGLDYEVFLSFRGKDTRKTFTDHLYTALDKRGIHTFRDNEELPIGENIGPALLSAIHQSKIAIPIFSTNYASSKWCLRELAEIVECMKKEEGERQITVMPVFYHVDPSDVRNQTGCYTKAFQDHQKKFNQETKGWRNALKVVGELKGWDLEKIADGHESELIQLILKEVWSKLRKNPLIVPDDNLVGIHSHVEEIMKLLNIGSNDVRTVGIHGLGGIGKTTIARYVYKTEYHHFEGCSFIADARETFQLRGLVHLQSQLIINILDMEDPNITSVDHGIHMIKQRLSKKKVLIVLDDVDQNIDLKAIIGNHDWFGCGSRIIITTRDKHILDVHGVDEIYKPKEMDLDHSLQLFSKYAFKLDRPPEQYLALSIDVVKTTGGLPLALEVIGSSLFGREESVFKAMVEELKKCPHSEVREKLKISYNGLTDKQKEMFLDIACFLIGMDKYIARYIWDFSSEAGLLVLHEKSLVKIGEHNQLLMHDQLRDLGREIIRQENPKKLGERSRLWSKDALEVLHNKTGSEKVEGLDLRGQYYNQNLMSEGFAAMTNLRLLRLQNGPAGLLNSTHPFSELRWLSWNYGWKNVQFAPTINPRKLAVLDLSNCHITKSWMGWSYIKVAESLKVLDLKSCWELSQTPNLSANLQLEVLILECCANLTTIDDSVGHLKSLVKLNLKDCWKLKYLPTSICELTSLESLDISLTGIDQLPENLGNLKALTELLIDRTLIRQLPNSIGDLRKLKTLSAQDCEIHEGGIPDAIGRLSSLVVLNMKHCRKLKYLPTSICKLTSLERLDISFTGIGQLPENLGNLDTLTELLVDDTSIRWLPNSIGDLRKLKTLSAQDCEIQEGGIPNAIGRLSSLEFLNLDGNQFRSLPTTVSQLSLLQTLSLDRCRKLRSHPNTINALTRMESLYIRECDALRYIRHLPSSLTRLDVSACENMREISAFSDVRNLVKLNIHKCNNLAKIEGLEGLDSLKQLVLLACRSLTKIKLPKKLQKLQMEVCEKLTETEGLEDLEKLIEIPSIGSLESLEVLKVCNCESMEILPDLSSLTKLRTLHIIGCKKLIEIQGVDRLEILEDLRIEWCFSIETLPSLSNLKKLKNLSAKHCKKLIEIQGVDRLEILEDLRIDGCLSIQTLPSLSNLKKLKNLSAKHCMKLTEIQGIDELESLKELNVQG